MEGNKYNLLACLHAHHPPFMEGSIFEKREREKKHRIPTEYTLDAMQMKRAPSYFRMDTFGPTGIFHHAITIVHEAQWIKQIFVASIEAVCGWPSSLDQMRHCYH